MKKILSLAGIFSLLTAVQAGAVPVPHAVTLSATVAAVCNTTTAPTPSSAAFSNVSVGSSNYLVTINNGQAQTTTGTLTFGSVVCNGGHIKVSLDPGGKAITTGTGADANQKIHYTARAKNSTENQLAFLDTSNSLSATPYGTAGYASGSISVVITILESTTTLVAGNYTGTLTIKIDSV